MVATNHMWAIKHLKCDGYNSETEFLIHLIKNAAYG